jgi:hypothetical protein
MKRVVDIYVESISGSGNYSKLELFNDEKIELTSSIQNIQDISKVYTDFTQSFTIPASTINNSILHHFYQSDVDVTDYDPNIRLLSYIEIDLTPFRSGKIQLEKAIIKNGRVDSYTITFYGDLINLKDKFGNDKLADLDYSDYNEARTGANIESLITSTDYTKNVRFPLISSKRVWTYDDGFSTDIKLSANAIDYAELFPAIKVARIFDLIASKYGITFTGTWLNSVNKSWDRLFLWLKNSEVYSDVTDSKTLVIYDVKVNGTPVATSHNASGTREPNIIELNGFPTNNNVTVDLYCESNVSCTIYVECFLNGSYVKTVSFLSGTGWNNLLTAPSISSYGDLTYKIKTSAPATINNINISVKDYGGIAGATRIRDIRYFLISTISNINIEKNVPDITIADFFSGILKMFNLTCYATANNTFLIETLEDFYTKGFIYDITTYTDIDSIEVNKLPLYKNISFNHQKSESFVNKEFLSNNRGVREYGDTKESFAQYDGGDFRVEVPFEELLPLNLDSSEFAVSYSLTPAPDFKSYIPKPVLLYLDDIRDCNFYFNNGTTTNNKTTYAPFVNEITFNSTRYSLSFGEEASVIDNVPLTNGLYKCYYASYLGNMFNPKCRLLNIKAHFPLSLITKLKLNNRLVIRDKRYIINELKSDITSGEVSLGLINDFRPMINSVIVPSVPSTGGVVSLPVSVPSTTSSIGISTTTPGVTFSTTTITTSTWVDVTAPTNPNPLTPFVIESGVDSWISDDGFGIINEDYTIQEIPIDFTYNNNDGSSYINTLNISQV